MPARVTISRRLRIPLSPRRRAVVVQREDRKNDLRRHVRRGAIERALEDRPNILIVTHEERRIAEVYLPFSVTEKSHHHPSPKILESLNLTINRKECNFPETDRAMATVTTATKDI